MSARQTIDEVLQKFAHQIGLPELHLTDNELSLAFDDHLRFISSFIQKRIRCNWKRKLLDYKLSILIFIVLFWRSITIGQNTNYFSV